MLRRRSRRLTRARQLGVPLERIGAYMPRVVSPAVAPVEERARESVSLCCAFSVVRQVSSLGTVFVIRQHVVGCPVWSVRRPG